MGVGFQPMMRPGHNTVLTFPRLAGEIEADRVLVRSYARAVS